MFYIENNELFIILINITIIFFCYFYLYPKYAGSTLKSLVAKDLFFSTFALLISGFIFWGKGIDFNALFFTTNWFWFSLLTFTVIEFPVFEWYVEKHDIKF